MARQPAPPTIKSATFKVLEGPGAGAPFAVQFNPASLEYTISTEFDDRNGNNGARQFVKKSSAKLTMTLIFDTTHTGQSVRNDTTRVARLLEPAPDGTKKFAPKVEFGWGAYSFKGVVEQFKETIDFFSADGVPLRSSINLTLASQEVEFRRGPEPAVDRKPPADPVSTPPGTAPSDVVSALGDPRAARGVASASGAASLRFGADVSLSVGGEISLAAAANFSAGAGLSAGVGVGAAAGFGVGGGAGLSIGGGAGVSIGGGVGAVAGAGAGIGVPGITATAGAAFAGLRVSPPIATVSVSDARAVLLPAPNVTGATSFGPGGRALVQGGGSLSADVGVNAELKARINFED